MPERKFFREVGKKGGRAIFSAILSINICPADDIAAVVVASVSNVADVAVHQGILPPENQFKPKQPDRGLKGKKLV